MPDPISILDPPNEPDTPLPTGDWYYLQPQLDQSTIKLLKAMGYMIAMTSSPPPRMSVDREV
jgi:hypothetical protein